MAEGGVDKLTIITGDSEHHEVYLFEAHKAVFIGAHKLPTKVYTIEQYDRWRGEYTYGNLSLTNSYSLQWIQNADIKTVMTINYIIKQAIEMLKIDENKIGIPFIGGISGDDFRMLLIYVFGECMKHKENNFWDVKAMIYDYYFNFLKEKFTTNE